MLRKGFTLIELLIVIGIVAILAAVVFIGLDPLTRFRDARDAARWTDITAILSAVRVDQVDHGGRYSYGIRHDTAEATGTPFMILDGNATSTNTCNASCDVAISSGNCDDLSQLVTRGYLGKLPVSPNGASSWSSTGNTGFYVQINSNNSITVGACESENTPSITVTR
mgnify:CR=1 FL=1